MIRLFNHVYLNDSLVTEALSALEGGLLGATEEVERRGSEKGVKGDVGAGPARVGGGITGSAASERKTTKVDTSEARFLRLITLLEEADALPFFDQSATQEDWYALRRGVLFEAQGSLEIGLVPSLGKPLEELKNFAKLASAFGVADGLDIPDEQIQQLDRLSSLTEGRPLPFSFHLGSSKAARAFGQLEPQYMRVTPTKASGEFSMFAKVTGFVEKGETFDMTGVVGSLMELVGTVNRQQRRTGRKQGSGSPPPKFEPDGQFILQGPALRVVPYSIAT